jgi:hypothetical protein
MLIQEALWFKEQIAYLDRTQIFPMCNVGSSTEDFRNNEQPYINDLIFLPVLKQGYVVKHLDMKSAPGVDLVGDLSDPVFFSEVSKMQFKSLFCSNILEHVKNREAFCSMLLSMIPAGGFLFISVPFSYPYHPDPIDTGFRPSISEIAEIFPDTSIICSAVVGGDTILKIRRRNTAVLILTLLRFLFPFYRPVSWWRNKGYVSWFFRPLTASCIILKKNK